MTPTPTPTSTSMKKRRKKGGENVETSETDMESPKSKKASATEKRPNVGTASEIKIKCSKIRTLLKYLNFFQDEELLTQQVRAKISQLPQQVKVAKVEVE